MFDRPGLKLAARERLKGNLVQPMLVMLLVSAIGGFVGALPTMFSAGRLAQLSMNPAAATDPMYIFSVMGAMLSPIGSILSFILSILVLIPISVAVNRYFIRFWRGEMPTFGSAFDGFSEGRLAPYIGASLWESLWLTLWCLPALAAYCAGFGLIATATISGSTGLMVAAVILILVSIALYCIPMVKSYSYMQTLMLVADNPGLGAITPLNLSKRIMEGHKMEAFVLSLSFIPWMLLVAVTCGLGILYVGPYISTTMAAYYDYVVDQALQKGVVSATELGLQSGYSQPSSGYNDVDPTINF